jgi:protoheme IX farnesyltransferase
MKALFELFKPRIALLAALSAAAGAAVTPSGPALRALLPALAVLALAGGACALNQYQERRIDAAMPRTARRPIPSGRLHPAAALAAAAAAIAAGLAGLGVLGGGSVAGLGLLAVLWYNGLYTPLKRRTAWAAVPGAVVGALPPLIGGWAAAGVPPPPAVWALAGFMILWQVPHFWLLLLVHADEYRRAGFPVLTERLRQAQLVRITAAWTLAAAVASLVLPLYLDPSRSWVVCLLLPAAAGLAYSAFRLLPESDRPACLCRQAFGTINGFAVLTLVLLLVDRSIVWH